MPLSNCDNEYNPLTHWLSRYTYLYSWRILQWIIFTFVIVIDTESCEFCQLFQVLLCMYLLCKWFTTSVSTCNILDDSNFQVSNEHVHIRFYQLFFHYSLIDLNYAKFLLSQVQGNNVFPNGFAGEKQYKPNIGTFRCTNFILSTLLIFQHQCKFQFT